MSHDELAQCLVKNVLTIMQMNAILLLVKELILPYG